MSPEAPAERPLPVSPRGVLVACVIITLGAAVRVAAASGDFWLDEIWSWLTTVQMRLSNFSGADILLRIHDENNHFLNTWFLYELGPDQTPLIYRLPNVFAGAGSIAVAGLIARRDGRPAAVAAMALVAGSYLLTHYSSEARGYGLVTFFSLLAFWSLDRALTSPSRPRELLFAASCIFGVLSQPVFIYVYASLFAWWLWRTIHAVPQADPVIVRPRRKRGEPIRSLPKDAPERRGQDKFLAEWVVNALRCHFLPVTFMAWLYMVNLRHMVNAGGPIVALPQVIAQTLSLTVGGPWGGWQAAVAALAVGVMAAAGIVGLYRARDDRWVFYLCVLCVMPGGLLLATGRSEVYPRYFIACVAFLCVLLGRLAGLSWQAGGRRRWVAALFVGAILAGNAVHIDRLLRLGRGQYLAALDYMQSETRGPAIRVSSDFDFRNQMVLTFYSRYLDKEMIYAKQQDAAVAKPEWLLTHEIDRGIPAPESIAPFGFLYRLERVYPYAGLSGWDWRVYRRVDEAPR